MTGKPLVSVVIPAWQAEETIAETLASLREQTLTAWEAIVVSDGSTDNTVKEATSLARDDPRIRVVEQAHTGVSRARNRGAALAEADWLLFLDADDWLARTHLERMIGASGEGADVVLCGYIRVAADGSMSRPEIPMQTDDPLALMAKNCPVAVHAVVVRRSVFLAVGGFDPELEICEDWDLWLRVAMTGACFTRVPEALAYYRMRKGSACSNGSRYLRDGLEVLRRGHSGAAPDALNPADLEARQFYYMSWIAGYHIGGGGESADFPAEINCPDDVSPQQLAWNLLESVPYGAAETVEAWPWLWARVEERLDDLLAGMAARSTTPALAESVRMSLVRLIVDAVTERPITAGPLHKVRVDVAEPLVDISVPAEVERLIVDLRIEGERLGRLEIPAVVGLVSADVVADAAAAVHAWELLRRHLERTTYPAGEDTVNLHNEIGWASLLTCLWGAQPAQTRVSKVEDDTTSQSRPKQLIVEVAADIMTYGCNWSAGSTPFVVTVGGSPVTVATAEVGNGGISAEELRGLIQQTCGFELCVAAVREGVIGYPLGGSLRERLLAKEASRADRARKPRWSSADTVARLDEAFPGAGRVLAEVLGDEAPALVLPRRLTEPTFFGSTASRRVTLPTTARVTTSVRALARRNGQRAFDWPSHGGEPSRIVYLPELLSHPARGSRSEPPHARGTGAARNQRHKFETIFAAGPEPWNYSSDYERVKYAEMLEMLPAAGINAALEVGCAEGHFTQQLASRVRTLVAADISEIALQRARERCRDLSNISYLRFNLGTDALPSGFDLIVCGEVLYYTADRADFARVAHELSVALKPGGYLLTAHAHVLVDAQDQPGFDWDDTPFGAAFIAETLSQQPELDLVSELRTPVYRIQLYRRVSHEDERSASGRSEVLLVERDVASVLDPEVANHFKPHGDASRVVPPPSTQTERLPILMYHRVATTGPAGLARYRVSPSALDEQLGYLRDADFTGVTMNEWMASWGARAPLAGRCVLITFDDAYVDFLSHAWPILKKHGFPATVYVPAGHVGGSSEWDARYGDPAPLLGWSDLRDLRDDGVQFGSHGWSHRPLDVLRPVDVAEEGATSRLVLEEQLQVPVTSFAYPYGRLDPLVTHVLGGVGYDNALTTQSGCSHFFQPIMQLSRIEVHGSDDLEAFIARVSDIPPTKESQRPRRA